MPRLRLSIIPNMGMETHCRLRWAARSLIPFVSLPNQTASLACSVKSPSSNKILDMPCRWGDVTIETKWFFSKCARHSSVLPKRFTNVHLTAETDSFESFGSVRNSFQSSERTPRGSMTYTFSAPKAFTFRMTVPIFRGFSGSSMTTIRFLHRKSRIASALFRARDLSVCLRSIVTLKPPPYGHHI